MKCLSFAKSKDELDAGLVKALSIQPTFVMFFASPELLGNQEVIEKIRKAFDGVEVIGCSSAAEITQDGLSEDTIAFLAVHFDHAFVRAVSTPLLKVRDSATAGEILASQLKAPNLKAVFVLAEGMTTNGSALLRGLYENLPRSTFVTGGVAADKAKFEKTYTFHNGKLFSDYVVAMGFYGDSLEISSGSEGGWRPFGPARRVTRSEDNVLFELDNRPALQIYDEYLGRIEDNSSAGRLSYPFAILREDRSNAGLIRAALGIDRPNNALILGADLPQGSLVCMMHAENDGLVQGAAQAAAEAIRTHPSRHQEGFAILVSCIARKLVMGIDVEDEIEAVRDSFDEGTPMVGFYSFGEICPYAKQIRPELHNQTMTITYITERQPDNLE